MKNFITILILMFIAVCSASAQTVIKYKHVYDVDENGVRFDDRVGRDDFCYIAFNSSKSQFYFAKDAVGNAISSDIYRFIKTENGIHYYGLHFDYTKDPNEGLMPWDIGFDINANSVYNVRKTQMKFLKGIEYVCFSTDFSKFNWQEIWKNESFGVKLYKDRDWMVYEKYVEPKQKSAPSILY